MTDSDDDLKIKLVRKLATNGVVGNHKKQIDTVKQWGIASHNEGRAEELLQELAKDPNAPVEKYGGRDVIRLTSIQDAKDYIVDMGGEIPWGI